MEDFQEPDELFYLEYLLDYYENPRNYGTIEKADIYYEEGNPSCGDVIRIDL